jgi:hypothetical protein
MAKEIGVIMVESPLKYNYKITFGWWLKVSLNADFRKMWKM